ncbi:MAG: IS110 family transposase [Chloroflexi bacterium]|nr:IS110 family transposase [Chloroflexota bacterium]
MPYWAGIDIAKREHQLLILDETGQPVGRVQRISNNRSGFESCVQTLQVLDDTVQVALEATGQYWLALYDHLTRAGFTVHVFNPIQIHAYRQTGVRRTKTDRRDAFWIADFLRIGGSPSGTMPLAQVLQLRELARFRFNLVDQIADNKRKVLSVLDRIFPEYERLFSDVFLLSSRRLLQRAVTPDEIAAFDLSELTELLRTHSHGRLAEDQAQAIIQAAQDSIGVSFLADAAQLEISCLLAQIEFWQVQVEQVDTALARLMAQLSQHLTSIIGIGPVSAATLLGEIGNVQRFPTLEKLVGYAGIDATTYQTGQFSASQQHMSKRGSPYLRRALWMAASVARMHDPDLKAYYERKRAQGKHHNTIIGALCRKLLARIYVVLKEQRPYERRAVMAGSATASIFKVRPA